MQHRSVGQSLVDCGIQNGRMRRADGVRPHGLALPVSIDHISQKLTWLSGHGILQNGSVYLHMPSLYIPFVSLSIDKCNEKKKIIE
jgi:hypothetical protein